MLTELPFPKEDSLGKGKHRDTKLYINRYINNYMAKSTGKKITNENTGKKITNENTGNFMLSLVYSI